MNIIIIIIIIIIILFIILKNKTQPVKKIAGCEINPPLLSCPNNKKIKSGNIKYGRWDNKICPHSTIKPDTKPVYKTYKIPESCIGKNSCQIGKLNTTFGDPYSGVYKQYDLKYNCY